MSEASVIALWTAAMTSLAPIPYALGQYLMPSGGELPNVFMVGKLIDDVPEQHADDQETQRTYRMQVSIYDRSGLSSLPNVNAAMLAQGFRKGPGRQLPYDPDTKHFGYAKDYFYLE